jgi:DnaJ-class molecular chaperone
MTDNWTPCRRCHGEGGLEADSGVYVLCTRCHGTGDEPA